jgi:hypothetical protein
MEDEYESLDNTGRVDEDSMAPHWAVGTKCISEKEWVNMQDLLVKHWKTEP